MDERNESDPTQPDTATDVFGAVDPDEIEGSTRRRWRVAAAIAAFAAFVIVVVGALVIAAPWDDSAASHAQVIVLNPEQKPGATPDEPITLEPRLMLGEVPDGFSAAWLNDGSDNGSGEMPETVFALFGTPDTEFGDGPWLSIDIAPMQASGTFNAIRWMRDNTGMQAKAEAVDVNGLDGARGDDWNAMDLLVFGPLEGGVVSIRSQGVAPETVLTYARGLRVVDGIAVLAENTVTTSIPLLATSSTGSGYWGFIYGNGNDSSNVSYTDTSGNGNGAVNINTSRPPAADPFPVIRFLLDEPRDATVHGQPAVVGTQDATFGGVEDTLVAWIEGGRYVVVSAPLGHDELLELAESVRPANDNEWSDLQDEAQENQERMNIGNGSDPFADGTFLVGAGNTSDGSRWRIEANFDHDVYAVCYSAASNRGMGCSSGSEPSDAVLERAGDFGFGFSGVVAFVDRSHPDARLEIVLGEPGSDTEPIVIPLHDIDASFPGPGAAWAGSTNLDYTANLVDGDATVLESIDIKGRG